MNNGQTNEAEVLDRVRLQSGDENVLGWSSLSSAKTPAEILMEEEDSVSDMDQSAVDAVRSETLRGLLSYFLRDFERYSDAADVGKRVIAMAKYCGHRSVINCSATSLAKACGESPAAMTDRVRRECNQIIEAMGGVAQAKWQQGATQRGVSAEAQMGNNNRVKNKPGSKRATLAERRRERK